jgi:hypothetical protein
VDPYESILKQSVQDFNQLNERVRLYFKKGQKDYDEFDNILLQLSMHVMQTGDNGVLEAVERLEDIKETFRRRANRNEFPTIKYLIYLQFSAVVAQEQELVDGLIRYGFDHLYTKLRPLDRVTALEIAAST